MSPVNCGPAQWDARHLKGYFLAGSDLLLGMEQQHLVKLWVCCYVYVSELHLYILVQLEDQHVLAVTVLRLVPGHCLHTTAKTISIPHLLPLPPKCVNRYEMSSTADSFYHKHTGRVTALKQSEVYYQYEK